MALKLDLVKASPVYLDFLEKWSKYDSLVSELCLRRILYRYEHLWLPLVSEWSQTDLEPPLDVYWVWHMHMLHPKLYVDYCVSRFGRVLSHKIRLSEAEERYAQDRSKLIWRDKYPAEQFDIELHSMNPGTYQAPSSKLFPLIHNAEKIMNFTYQVSLPHFRDFNFMSRALDRYRQFLALKRVHPYSKIALPIDILVMWRLHALHPTEYEQEALKPYRLYSLAENVGYDGRCLLDYGYNDGDWNSVCDKELLVPGSAFRGSPGFTSIKAMAESMASKTVTDECTITVDKIMVSDLWSNDKKLLVVVKLLGNSSFSGTELTRFETTVNKLNAESTRLHFNAKENRGIEFVIYAIRGICSCARGEVHLNSMLFNPREPFGAASFSTKDFAYQIPKVSHVDPKVTFQCRLKAVPPPPHTLSLDRKPLKAKPLPKEIIPFVRELPKWREAIAKEGKDGLEFTSAKHSLTEREGELSFSIEVVKQNDLDLGAVLIHQGDSRLVAAAYTVGDETLASPAQLTSKCPVSLDPESDEQAMLVGNHEGEWAVVKAKWEQHSDGGRVKIVIFFLKSHKDLTFYIKDDEMQKISFGDVVIDMPTGRLSIDARNPEIVENIALAFSVGILYVSCQVRATILSSRRGSMVSSGLNGSVRSLNKSNTYDLHASINSTKSSGTPKFNVRRRNKQHTRKRKMSASFTFLLAAGLQIDVTLYGSTGKNQRPVSRASLASIHLLYERPTPNDNSQPVQTYYADARNNNTAYGAENQNHINAYDQTDVLKYTPNIMTPNGKNHNGSIRNGSDKDSDSGRLYMDIRL